MMDLETYGNLIESFLWASFAAVFLFKARHAPRDVRQIFLRLAAAFFAFGISDIVESQTGAWWTPPWLLILKVACASIFLSEFRKYYGLRRRLNPHPLKPSPL